MNTKKTTYSIRQINASRGNPTWYGCIYRQDAKPEHISLHTTSRKAAQAWLTKMQADELLPPLLRRANKDVPLQQAEDDYKAAVRISLKEITYKTYVSRLNPSWKFLAAQGITSVRGITQGVLLKLIESFADDRRKTLKERYKTLRWWLMWVQENYDLADFEPWRKIKLKKTPADPEKEFWTVQQLEAILKASPTKLYRLFIGLQVYAGLRYREALTLRWEDLSADLSTLTLVGKMDKLATLPIAEKLKALIQAVKVNDVEGRIFKPGEFPQQSWELIPLLKTVVMEAGLQSPGKIGHHKIRHSFATNLLLGSTDSEGVYHAPVDLKTVSRALRHAQTSTTLTIYCHTTDEAVRNAVNKL